MYFASVDLEKGFDRVPRDVVRGALKKLDVESGWSRLYIV